MEAAKVLPVSLGFVRAFAIRGEKVILIDTGVPGSATRILGALNEAGIEPGEVSLILITHGHWDHCGGAAELKEKLSCPLAIHAADADVLRTGVSHSLKPVGTLSKIFLGFAPKTLRNEQPLVQPDIVFEGSFDLSPYGVAGTAEPTPGHTPGSVSVFLQSDDAIVGDLVGGSMLFPNAARWPIVADDLGEVRQSMAKMLARNPARIWTSHGRAVSVKAVETFLARRKDR